MRYLKLGDAYIVRLATGDEIHASLEELATLERIDTAGIEGVGSVYDAVLGTSTGTRASTCGRACRETWRS